MDDHTKKEGSETSFEHAALEFLKVSEQFRLGHLPTESPHPKSVNLALDARQNVALAIETIKDIDLDVFYKLKSHLFNLRPLQEKIAETIKGGGNIFLCGCGATGRLSLALETIWRYQHEGQSKLVNRIVSFMAGGDAALIRSIEKFEDYPEYGERQLRELGFKEGDLLISTTEGGETPFVIGATEAATTISSVAPFFLYCNPDDILMKTALRSKNVLTNSHIKKINMAVGPMALTGSTRMQATTILMYAVGLSLWFYDRGHGDIEKEVIGILEFIQRTNFDFLKPFIEKESEIYRGGGHIFYETDPFLGITLLTDTTERSPTFSLHPFENQQDSHKDPSLAYLYFPGSKDAETAWRDLLLREPRTFDWPEVTSKTTRERVMGFDFSAKLPKLREEYLKKPHHFFKIYFSPKQNEIHFELGAHKHTLSLGKLNFLSAHLVLKILMNNLSTVIMGRMGRYESNLMTWVRASNNKLVDRAVRYAHYLLHKKGFNPSYEELVHACFRLKGVLPEDQSLVLKMVEEFSKKSL